MVSASWSRYWFIALAALALFIPGCATRTASVNMTDNNCPQYQARLRKSISDRQLIELDYARSKGSSRQYYPAGSRLNLDQREFTITSPMFMENDFTLSTASIKWGVKPLQMRWINLNVYAGLRGTLLEMDYMENALPRHLNNYSYGPTASVEAVVPFLDSLSAEYRVTGSWLWMDNYTISYTGQIILNFHPVSALELYGGWYIWEYQNSEHPSDINIELQGPTLGMSLSF